MSAAEVSGGNARRWRESWIGLRNRLIADRRFQRWAAASPFTKFIARRRARALFDLCAGFVYSQILLACVRLRVFDLLAQGPRSLEALAPAMALSPDAALRLLRAAVALRLLRALPDDCFALDDLGASLRGNPSVAALIEHHSLFYEDMRDPVALLRGEGATQLSRFWPYSNARPNSAGLEAQTASGGEEFGSPPIHGAYSELMSASQALVGEDILDAYPLDRRRSLLDVGGGEGAFLATASARSPSLRLCLFDLPPVAQRARQALEARGLASRVQIFAGSFLDDPLPAGSDAVSLVRVIHDHDDESANAILRRCFACLPSGGVLLLGEPMAQTPGAEAMGDAYFGFYLLAMGRGRPRSSARLKQMLESAGFARVRSIPTRRPMLASLIVGERV